MLLQQTFLLLSPPQPPPFLSLIQPQPPPFLLLVPLQPPLPFLSLVPLPPQPPPPLSPLFRPTRRCYFQRNIKHFVYSIYYFQHIEMAEIEEDSVDPESNVEVVATSSSVLPPDAAMSSSVPPPEKVDKSTNIGLSVQNWLLFFNRSSFKSRYF